MPLAVACPYRVEEQGATKEESAVWSAKSACRVHTPTLSDWSSRLREMHMHTEKGSFARGRGAHPHEVAKKRNCAGNEDCEDNIDGPVDQPEEASAAHTLLCHQGLNHVKHRHPAPSQGTVSQLYIS